MDESVYSRASHVGSYDLFPPTSGVASGPAVPQQPTLEEMLNFQGSEDLPLADRSDLFLRAMLVAHLYDHWGTGGSGLRMRSAYYFGRPLKLEDKHRDKHNKRARQQNWEAAAREAYDRTKESVVGGGGSAATRTPAQQHHDILLKMADDRTLRRHYIADMGSRLDKMNVPNPKTNNAQQAYHNYRNLARAKLTLHTRLGTPQWLSSEARAEADDLIPDSGRLLLGSDDVNLLFGGENGHPESIPHAAQHEDLNMLGGAVMLEQEFGFCVPTVGPVRGEGAGGGSAGELCARYHFPRPPVENNSGDVRAGAATEDAPTDEGDSDDTAYALTKKFMLVVNPKTNTLYVVLQGTTVDAGIAGMVLT